VAATTLTPVRALRQPRRLDGRALAGLFLTVVSIFGAMLFWSTSSRTRPVVIATGELPAGAQLAEHDLAVAQVAVDDSVYRAAVPGADRLRLVGRQLSEPAHAGQVLVRPQVATRPPLAPDQMAVTIPVSADVAPGLRVRPGALVDVFVTYAKGTPGAQAQLVVERASVYDVAYDDRRVLANPNAAASGGPGDDAGRVPAGVPVAVTLAVTRAEAERLAGARWGGSLDIAVLPAPGP
jgi:Flp pilus assembly protein CpaB